jgi:hypothetical protein
MNGNNFMYETVDKATGKSTFTAIIGVSAAYWDKCSFSSGADGSVYIYKGDSVIKYADAQLSTRNWNKKVGSPGGITAVQAESDGVFFFGNGDTYFAGKLNNADGSTAWMSGATFSSNILQDYVRDFKIYRNCIYIVGQHQFFGSTYSGYHISAIDRATGKKVWESVYNLTDGNYISGNSLDADAFGNVYVSGYENGNDSRSGVWGVCKFDSTGKLKYHSTIFDGTPYNSQFSRGMLTFVYDNRVFHVGELQRSQTVPSPLYNSSYCNVYLAATDTSSVFNPYHKVTTRAGYQEFSNVLDIVNFSTGKYAVLKQVGASASIELRDALRGTVLWSRNIKRGWYLAADKMCVTADNLIAFTAISHDAGQSLYDYRINADSLYLFKFDSLGTISTEKNYSIQNNQNFRTVQLYPSRDTNTVLLFSQVDVYGDDNSLHIYNFDKGDGKIGSFDDYLSSLMFPAFCKQNLLCPLSHDSVMTLQRYKNASPANVLLYLAYTFKSSGGGGYSQTNFQGTGLNITERYIVPCDSSSVIVVGANNYSGKNVLTRFSTKKYDSVWTVTDLSASYTMDMGSCSKTKIYLTGRKDGSLVIRQANISNGGQNWEKLIVPASTNQYYVPVDQKFNAVRNQYTIAGYIADTSAITPFQSAFYITVDTNGTIVKQWMQSGDYIAKNSLNTVNVTQFGQTLIGGALYIVPYGRSGVFIEGDSAFTPQNNPLVVTISAYPSGPVCAGDSILLRAKAPDCGSCSYSWSANPAGNSDSIEVNKSGTYTVTVIRGSDTVAASQTVTITPLPAQPTIAGINGYLISSSNIGNQWYLNGQLLKDSGNQEIKPASSGNYSVQVSQTGCPGPMSAVFPFTPGANSDSSAAIPVTVYPNPATDILNISNILAKPIHLSLFNMGGSKQGEISGSSTNMNLNISSYPRGVYYIVITDDSTSKQKSMLIFKL